MNEKKRKSGERSRFYPLVQEITARLVSARGEEIDAAVDDCLAWMGEHFGVGAVSLGGITKSGELTPALRVWGGLPRIDKSLALDPSPGPEMAAQFAREGSFIYGRLEDLDEFPQYRDHTRRMGAAAAVFWAHRDMGSYVEGMAISSPDPKVWPDDIVERLATIGGVLFNALYRRRAEMEAERLRVFEHFVSETASKFVHLPTEQVDGEIEKVLGRICECVDADMVTTLYWKDEKRMEFTVSHEWHASSIDAPFHRGTIIPADSWLTARLKDANAVVISNLDEFPPEAASVRETCVQLGLWSILWAPFSTPRGLQGYLAIGTINRPGSWSEDVISLLGLVGNVFASALERRKAELETKRLQMFEHVVSEATSRFVYLPTDQVDGEIEKVLGQVCKCIDADIANLLYWNDQKKTAFTVSHEWVASAIDGPSFRGTVISDEYPWLAARLREGKAILISEPDDLPPEAAREREAFERIGLRSIIYAPFLASHGLQGYVALHTVNRPGLWPEGVASQLGLMGNVFASAMERRQADIELEQAYNEIRKLKDHIEAENITLREEIKDSFTENELIGKSHTFRTVLHQAEQVGCTDSTVLLLGDTGTGKGLIARRIHQLSGRKDRLLVTVNCAALPAALIESELFGHEKGAFTGATERKIGRFELADGGTIFLDEVGDLPLELQAKLLRVLQDQEFERLGSSTTMTVDARVMAATNRDLDQLISRGAFRTDLYYRLGVFPIRIPPLRERRDDIPLLVWFFITSLQTRLGKTFKTIPTTVMDALISYDWPGNVRELRNVIERAMILSPGSELELKDILPVTRKGTGASTRTSEGPDASLEEVDRAHIISVLEDCSWRVRGEDGAAERLGLKRSTLQSRMQKLGIRRPTN